eukprot:9227881-Lingulodinium_polyedra.AAC.1
MAPDGVQPSPLDSDGVLSNPMESSGVPTESNGVQRGVTSHTPYVTRLISYVIWHAPCVSA